MEPGSHARGFTVDDYQMALKTVRLEKELQDTFGKTAQILGTEETRMKRVEQLFLLFDNEDLRLQLDQANLKLSKALKAESKVRFQLHVACDELNHLRSASFTSSKEIKGLEDKLASLANVNADYQKLVAENVHLSKDLARIQLEVEAFRTQQSGSFVPLTEKRNLERQLHSLESQMANERQIHERTLTRESQQAKEIASLNARLEEQGRRLAEEVQVRNCREQEIRQQGFAWTAQPLSGEKRPEPSSRKALSPKDVSQAGSDDKLWTHGGVNDIKSCKSIHQTHSNPRQPVSKFHTELTIATPGAIHARERKRKPSALPGDKSSFSITPFLNRTSGIPESPISSDGSDELHASQAHAGRDTLYSKASLIHDSVNPQPQDQPRLANKSITQLAQRQPPEPPSSITNVKPKANQRPSNKSDTEGSAGGAFAATNLSTQTQSRPKKRKLGAQRDKILFDGEDEGDELQDMRKPARKFASDSTAGRNAGLDFGPLSVQTGGHLSRNRGFGEFSDFSPLKRDRRRQ